MDKIDSKSLDITEDNIGKLKELFPNVVTEGKIDFDVLRALLGDEVEKRKERYQFTWPGKAESIKIAQAPSAATLRPCKEKSKNWETTENLYIEGDNLEVLKQLQKTYYGKIKMIYIDPPYNTGKDFVYRDNFTNSIESYVEQTKQIQVSNPNTSGRFHSDWLNMIYPRLLLARNLLSSDGVIFISIDDNEYSSLEKMCNEVFGENNRLETFHIQVRYANKSLNEKDDFQKLIEYCLIYAKDKQEFTPKLPGEEYDLSKFRYEIKELADGKAVELGGKRVEIFKPGEYSIIESDSFGIGKLKATWASGSVLKGNTSGKFFDSQLSKRKAIDGVGVLYKVYGIGEDGLGYRYFTGPKKENATKGQFYSGVPLDRIKEINEGVSIKHTPIINFYDYSPDFGNIRQEGGVPFNSGKKPVKMLKSLIDITNASNNDIVMDFFSGSASTAHAIMSYSLENQKPLHFIMVQLPEIDSQDEEYETICDLGEERIRRAGEKIKKEWEEKNKSEGLFGEDKEFPVDIGFKVFKLDSTNITPWDNDNELDEKTIFAYGDVFKEDRTKEDVLYEIMLKYGIFDQPVNEIEVNGKQMVRVGKRHMIVCLEDHISERDIFEIGKLSPRVVVFKESGFDNDNDKINAEYNLKKSGVEDVKCV